MGLYRVLIIVTVAVGGMVGGPVNALTATREEVAVPSQVHMRVFYLQGMGSNEATTLLRSQAQVPKVASLSDRGVVVAAGPAVVVEKCEALLRDRQALLRVASPHGPLADQKQTGDSLVPHDFSVTADDEQTVVVLLRAIYSIRVLSERAEDNIVSIEATQPVLDAIEALLRELEVLAPAD